MVANKIGMTRIKIMATIKISSNITITTMRIIRDITTRTVSGYGITKRTIKVITIRMVIGYGIIKTQIRTRITISRIKIMIKIITRKEQEDIMTKIKTIMDITITGSMITPTTITMSMGMNNTIIMDMTRITIKTKSNNKTRPTTKTIL